MPLYYDGDELDRKEERKNTIFKIVEPFLWLIVIIIVIGGIMALMIAVGGYFS